MEVTSLVPALYFIYRECTAYEKDTYEYLNNEGPGQSASGFAQYDQDLLYYRYII